MYDSYDVDVIGCRPFHKFVYHIVGFQLAVDVFQQVSDSVNDNKTDIGELPETLLDEGDAHGVIHLTQWTELHVYLVVLSHPCHLVDAPDDCPTMWTSLLRIYVQHHLSVWWQCNAVIQYGLAADSCCSNSRHIKSLATLGLSSDDGEIA